MACRCVEIQKCEQDIRLMERGLAQELSAAQRNCSQGTVKMLALGSDLTSASYVGNMARIDTRLAAIKKNQDGRVSNSLAKCSSELSRIQSRLISYDNEDRRYHEMKGQQVKR
jgi:hypothetical protein